MNFFQFFVAEADTIVFDKTGTLTCAQPKVAEIITFGDNDADEMLRLAACLEEHFPHSVANAVISTALMERINRNYRDIVTINGSLIGLGVLGVIQPSFSALLHNTSTLAIALKSTTKLIDK